MNEENITENSPLGSILIREIEPKFVDQTLLKIRERCEREFEKNIEDPVTLLIVSGMHFAGRKEGEEFHHWAIKTDKYYYYLVFFWPPEVYEGHTSRQPSGVVFQRGLCENLNRAQAGEVIKLGNTRYKSADIMMIGKYLLNEFRSYSQIFWNCSDFTRMLVKLLTNDECVLPNHVPHIGSLFRWGFPFALDKASFRLALHKELEPEFNEIVLYEKNRQEPISLPAKSWWSNCQLI